MAVNQGATRDEVKELLVFLCGSYSVNKLPHFFTAVKEAFETEHAS
jgi:hypothetical protein